MSPRNTRVEFEKKFIPEPMSGCWLWEGYSPEGTYGAINWWPARRKMAHVVSYEIYKGPIPPGLVIDHLCKNTWCVNPDHLEAVTQLQNMQRSIPATKTHCVHGHPYADGVERYVHPLGEKHHYGYRRCLTCYRMKYPGTKK